MNPDIKAMHVSVIDKVFMKDYYVSIFSRVLESKNMSLEQLVDMNDPEAICTFWNVFWFALPDSMNIRREPFFEICDLAEGSYLIPEDDYIEEGQQ